MEIPRDKRRTLAHLSLIGLCLIAFMFFTFLVFTFFAPNAFPAIKIITSIKTFTLTINSKQVTVILPPELPDMEMATFKDEACFNLHICMQRFCMHIITPGHDHVDFVFTNKGEVFALVWIRTALAVYVVWKYVDGLPILSSIEEIKGIIKNNVKPPTTI